MSDKWRCRFHPEAAARAVCNKFEYGYCEACLETCATCTDPKQYCTHRTQCFIWEQRRGRSGEAVKR